jgi:hypothetical protein
MADCKAKGRAKGPNYRGSKIGTAKLTEGQIVEIKHLLSKGVRCAELGRQFNVTAGAISKIKFGKNWSHIEAV